MAIVIDLGSGSCKAGFNVDELPSQIFPSVIGTYRHVSKKEGVYVGRRAEARMAKPVHLHYDRPIVNGSVENWDGVETLVRHAFELLDDVAPDEHAVCVTNFRNVESSGTSDEKMAEILFETFHAPAVYMPPNSAVLVLYALGKTEGLVMELGHGINVVTALYEGCQIARATSNVAGGEVTEFLAHLLNLKGHSFYTSRDLESIRLLKELHAGVSANIQEDATLLANAENQPVYTFPDTSKTIQLGDELFKCTEILFEPHGYGTFGHDMKGIHEMAIDCIRGQPTQEIHDVLSSNIVLTGGTSLLPGLKQRLEADVLPKVAAFSGTSVVADERRAHLAWRGAAMYASKDEFVNVCATKQDYDDEGAVCIRKKCK